ncbi:MAG: Trm112 family protein [Candidatus Eiseniibacteriota bacterium]
MSIDPELLEMLVCPLSRAPLVLDEDTLVSTDPATRRRYRIDDGIPVMLVDESEQLDEATWREILARHGRA